MNSSIKSKILTVDVLMARPSKPSNYQSENSSIKKISKSFSSSLEVGLKSLVEIALEISGADFSLVHLSSIGNEIFAGEEIKTCSEAIQIHFKLADDESGYLLVGFKNDSRQFDSEDYRVLESLAEISSAFIQNYHLITLEKDNLERVFNSTPSASAIWRGEDLIFDRVNDAYKALFPDLDLEGKPFEEALPQRIIRDYPGLFRNVLHTGKPFSINEQYTPVQHYAGGPLEDHYYNVNFVQLKNRDGSPYGVYQHTVDITSQVEARKKLEAETNKLEAVFNDSPAALAMFRGKDAVFEKINQRWADLVGPREYIGRKIQDVYPELSTSGLFEIIREVFETGEAYRGREMEFLVDIGEGKKEKRFYDFTHVRVLDGEGKPYGVFCHATNVTENKKFNELLKSTLKARDIFMSIASHELNTPITSLKLQTQLRIKSLLKDNESFPPEKNLKFLNHNLSQINRLSLLVNDMLDVGRINSGHFSMVKKNTNLKELLTDTVERFSAHFEAVGSKLLADFESDFVLDIDPLRIDQVVTNFLTNALKYAAKGSVTVILKREGPFVIVAVKDEGEGIEQENRLRIFQRFERATSERNISGMGLGLFLSKEIISAHNGIIDVNSELGKGSEFYFKLPL